MVFLVSNLNCDNSCDCLVVNSSMSCIDFGDCNMTSAYSDCSSGYCSYSYTATCPTENSTTTESSDPDILPSCVQKSAFYCMKSSVQYVDVVLLALVNLQLTIWTFGTIFKAYIYPITVPSYILFLSFWQAKDKKSIITSIINYMIGQHDLPVVDAETKVIVA